MKEKRTDFFRLPWVALGTIDATAGSADLALGVAERLWSVNKDLDNVVVWDDIPPAIQKVELRFKLTTAEEDVDIDIWAKRKGSDELMRVCTIDLIAGTQVAADGKLFADSSTTLTNKDSAGSVTAVGAAEHCMLISFNLCGYNGILLHGYGTCDEDCIVEASGWAD